MMKAVRSELFVVYLFCAAFAAWAAFDVVSWLQAEQAIVASRLPEPVGCLLYTSDAADEVRRV